jgi:arylsulfatase
MIDRMDQGIGKLVAELKRTNRFENTLIFYLQDNGGCAENMGRVAQENHPNIPRPDRPTLAPMKPTDFAAAGSVPAQTRDGYPVRMGNKVFPGPADTYVAYGRGWANVSNTPFREYKHWVHEGGISTPLIAHWPSGIKARGQLRREPSHLIDIMATSIELAAAVYPADATPLEGRSLMPVFNDQPLNRDALFWEHEGNRAVRVGDWKLVAKNKQPWELYNIQSERTESNDLAASMPEKVREMSVKWDAWAQRMGVLPYPLRPRGEK